MSGIDAQWQHLIELAQSARENAYAPYSGFLVGASLLGSDSHCKQIFSSGCNIENLSFGATICAERAAIADFVTRGGRTIDRIVVISKGGVTPCGICRQVLSEFCGDSATEILCQSTDGAYKFYKLSDLLPNGFESDDVERTESNS